MDVTDPSIRDLWSPGGPLPISLVVAVEEGAERSPAAGDTAPEPFAEGYSPEGTWRNWFTESIWEYGARRGIWRLLDAIEAAGVPASFAWCGRAAEANPDPLQAAVQGGHEILCRGLRSVPGPQLDEDAERWNIIEGRRILEDATGRPVDGWFGRWPSRHTRRLVIDTGFSHESDSHAADHPFVSRVDGRSITTVPWTPELDDERFWTDGRMAGYQLADDLLDAASRASEQLRRERAAGPRVMTLIVRPRISGRPERIGWLTAFLERHAQDERFRFLTRGAVAGSWASSRGAAGREEEHPDAT
jgi:peptidoglycan/xylan/chitin deacetylase (PgdA/CDA1 family)